MRKITAQITDQYQYCLFFFRKSWKKLHQYLIAYQTENNIVYPFQLGFRKKHSTYMPIAHIYDTITKALEQNEISCGVYLDLKKAFYTVEFQTLLEKLMG